ncbi:MAG: ABC transporter substrate-binding protein [Betaproteobacteria bacterium]
MTSRVVLALLLAVPVMFVQAAQAQTLRWSNQGNYLSADPHAQNTIITTAINGHVYDRLVLRGKKLEFVPGLAASWTQTAPTVWVFNLRKGVKWHDGSDFTADDVVFSIRRAQGPTSGYRVFANAAGAPRKIDDYTVEFTTPVPNPVMLDSLGQLFVMSKAWCEKYKVQQAQDFVRKEETHAARNAMGTGPFVLVSHEPDVKTVLRKNPRWWGIREGLFDGNVKEVVYTPLASDATRLAALASGGLDFVLDPPPQDIERLRRDPNIRIIEGPENTAFFLGMDQNRDELLYSSIKGRNPFKDVRVRRALYHAIDMDAISRTVLRGFAKPTAFAIPNPESIALPQEMDRRLRHDPAAANKLLADAGYPSGFTVTMDCDSRLEKVCTALVAMLAKAGITVNIVMGSPAVYYAKIRKLDTSLYIAGWVSSVDPIITLQSIVHGRDDSNGDWNVGNFRDLKLDDTIDKAKVELDLVKRRELIIEAVRMLQEGVYMVPLYRRLAPWASRANVQVVHRPDMTLEALWVNVR